MSVMENRRFAYEDTQGNGIISLRICEMTVPYTEEEAENVFSIEEWELYRKKKNLKRRKEMFWSRKMAKDAICDISDEKEERQQISIGKGQLGHPIVKGRQRSCQVSITHCPDYAAAVAFPEEIMIGLDMERVAHKAQLGIEEILTDREQKLIPDFLDKELFALVMWTAKEALGKFLKLGLTMNLEVLQITDVRPAEGGYRLEFRFFPGLTAYACVTDEVVYTMVYSKSITLTEKVKEK